jgi:hypothetical protein
MEPRALVTIVTWSAFRERLTALTTGIAGEWLLDCVAAWGWRLTSALRARVTSP